MQVFTCLLLNLRPIWLYFESVLFSSASNVMGSLVAFFMVDSILFVLEVKQVSTAARNKATIKVSGCLSLRLQELWNINLPLL